MTPDPLPPDLLALERELAARPQPGPPAGLRARVLATARHELTLPRPTPASRRFIKWSRARWDRKFTEGNEDNEGVLLFHRNEQPSFSSVDSFRAF